MMVVWQYFRSLIFFIATYVGMVVLVTALSPLAVLSREGAIKVVKVYTTYLRFVARWLVGIKTEIRGNIPSGDVLIAAKHQSFFDILLLANVLPEPRFVMKESLTRVPILGWFGKKLQCLPVDRSQGMHAMKKMLRADSKLADSPAQLVIYPQGTRTAPDEILPYKAGIGALYTSRPRTCIPVAVNVGLFWPRRGIMRHPGTAVVSFLDPIVEGCPRDRFMLMLEEIIEKESNLLMREVHDAKIDNQH